MTLILLNAQGASEQYTVATKAEARRIIRGAWADPERLTARLIGDDGEMLYEGSALGLK